MNSLLIVAAVVLAADVRTEVEVETLAGRRVAGALADFSHDGVTLRTADGETKLAPAEIASVVFATKQNPDTAKVAARIELVDGTQLVASELTRSKGKFTWKSPLDRAADGTGGSLSLEGRDVRTIRYQDAGPAVLDRFAEIASRKATGDQIVVRRGEQTVDSLSGIIRDITAENVQFEIDGELRPVAMKRVFGLVFYQPVGRDLKKPKCMVSDSLGMKFPAAALKLDGDKVTITSPAGLEFSRSLDALARIDFAASKTMYLGDIKHESIEWKPLVGESTEELALLFQPRVDRALFGGPLQLPRDEAGRHAPAWPYAKGIAIHSRTKLVYRLPRSFRSFTATAGIDSRARPAGSVRLVIDGDDKQLYAGTLTGKDTPVALNLDVQGVKRLTVLVDFGDDLDVADHLNLCDAKLVE